MGAAFLTPGEAFIDAIAISLVGNDEDAAVGGGGRGSGKQENTGNEYGGKSHGGHRQGKKPPSGIGPKG